MILLNTLHKTNKENLNENEFVNWKKIEPEKKSKLKLSSRMRYSKNGIASN